MDCSNYVQKSHREANSHSGSQEYLVFLQTKSSLLYSQKPAICPILSQIVCDSFTCTVHNGGGGKEKHFS
jgi:hypothetical protein